MMSGKRTGRTQPAVWLLAAALAAGGAEAQEATPSEPLTESGFFRIGPEDVLLINVWGNAELTRQVPVRPDGKISLPLLNDVQAAGLTPMELREKLRVKLVEFVPAGEVSVIVLEVHSFKVSVIGKVNNPGRLELKSTTTVLDALAQAGGLAEYADADRIAILRIEQLAEGNRRWRSSKRIPFNYKKVTNGEAENFALAPDDIIVVP